MYDRIKVFGSVAETSILNVPLASLTADFCVPFIVIVAPLKGVASGPIIVPEIFFDCEKTGTKEKQITASNNKFFISKVVWLKIV